MLKIITSLSAEKRLQHLISRLTVSDSAVLIVPEQFLFETERSMYHLLGARKIASTEITGFSKLAADIIAKHGTPKLYADDIVKTVTMVKTLSRLSVSAGFPTQDAVRRWLDIAANLKSASITPDILREKSVNLISEDSVLSLKLTSLAEIYSVYCDTLEKDFADKLDDIRVAADLFCRPDVCTDFSGKEIFLYEFDSFSASQLGLIKVLAETGDVSVLLRTDSEMSEKSELRAMNSLIKRIKRELAEIPYEFVALGGESFAPETQLWIADSVYDECEFVAAEIRRLITKENYTCNEIAVFVCDSAVTPRLKETMADYEVQVFADLPQPIILKPMTRFIISALEASGLNTPEFLSYIRSGFVRVRADLERFGIPRNLTVSGSSGRQKERRYEFFGGGGRRTKRLSKRSMDLLECAAYRYALTKREWGKPFPEQNKDLADLEPLRREVVQPLADLQKSCRDTTGDKITEVLCEFLLETMQLQRTVLGLCNGFELLEHKSITEEFRQLWDLIIDVFESLHISLADFPMRLADYTELLQSVFSSVNIAKPPAVLDAAAIGDLDRSRLNDVKIAFVTGANSGRFPKSAGIAENGGFSGREIEELVENGLELQPKLEERYNYERLTVNKALTLPSEKLYITAPLSGLSWEELTPCSFFTEKERTVKKTSDLPLSFFVRTTRSARKLLPKESFDKASNSEQFLTSGTAEKLFNLNRFSPTGIETMMSCRFKFFCKYGLGIVLPDAENEDEPAARERGNIIHYCLDRALREAYSLKPDSALERFVESCIREYRELKLPFGYAQTKRQSYILMSFKSGIVRMVKHIRDDFERSGWKPGDFEKRVDFPLGDIRLTGKIDRVDRHGEEVRVIDYKSGNKEMNFPSVFYGLDMQMLLYLFSVGGKPHSALYLPADGAKTKGGLLPNASDTEREKSWLSAHTPSGIIIGEEVKKSTDTLKRLTSDAYGRLKNHSVKLIHTQVNRVKRGDIQAVPVSRTADCAACEYCDFGLSCNKSKVKLINKECIERVINEKLD
ncbi:MAG: PD-(D/E)XK nuclease family protein [Oscillospiraceae bacterium]|nr:PD-(D/E)XK nuclease family protein [Oscillospiraceae bacterium]